MEELIELSIEKGFESTVKMGAPFDLKAYLWMCELQKWLREKHCLDVVVFPFNLKDKSQSSYTHTTYESGIPFFDMSNEDTFEKTLEKGLINALGLLK